VYGYLARNPDGVIHVRTNEPDYSNIQGIDWEHSVYSHVSELIPDDAPLLLGKPVVMTTYIDANLYHDLITGHAATGILHLVTVLWLTGIQNARLLLRPQCMGLDLLQPALQQIR